MRSISRIFALIALHLLTLSSAWAVPEIQLWHTGNGAKVLFVEAPDLPMLDVRVVAAAGSARDGERPGLATLTNGMLTQGAGEWSADEIAERLDDVGADLDVGALRDMAWVSVRTLTRAPALDTALDTLAVVLAQPRFDQADFERERQTTLIGLSLSEQKPGSVGQKALYRRIYGDHPYASYPSGTEEAVKALTREDLQAFHQRYYVGKNTVLAMVGALTREQAEQVAERVLGGLPAGAAAPALPPVPVLQQEVTERLAFPSTQTHIYAGQPGMRRGDPDYFPLYVGNHILGGSGLVSLLMEEVREKRGLSYSVYSYFLPMYELGPFMMGLQTKNAQAKEAGEVLMETVRRFVETGPSEEELTAAKQNITGGFPLRIASNQKVVQYLAMIGFYNLPLDWLNRFNERVEAVSVAQIQDAFRRRVHPERFAVVIVGPDDERVAQAIE